MGVPIITGMGEKRKRGRAPSKGWSVGAEGYGQHTGPSGSWDDPYIPSDSDLYFPSEDDETSGGNFTPPDDSIYWQPPEEQHWSSFFPDDEDIPEEPPVDQEFGLQDNGISADWMAPSWWDDPDTDIDEWKEFIYHQKGGWDATGLTLEEFFSDKYHGAAFPDWDQSGDKVKYGNVLEQLDMLNEKFTREETKYDIDLKALKLQSETNLEKFQAGQRDISSQGTAQFVGRGGGASGRALKSIKDANKNLRQALTLESRNININKDILHEAYDDMLDTLETDKMDFVDDLITIEDEYESKLVSLIDSMTITQVEDRTTAGLPDFDTNNDGITTEEEALAGQALLNEQEFKEENCGPCVSNCNQYIVQFQEWEAPAGGPEDLPTSFTQAEIDTKYNDCIQSNCPDCA